MGLRRDVPLWGALAVLWASMAAILWVSLSRTDGRLVYSLDDAYIHMAIAKHFTLNGVWGVTPYAFGSSTSSPLWTGLLAAAFRLIGPREWVPLALNVVFATLTLAIASAALRERLSGAPRFGTLVAALWLSRLPVVALSGMEHTLQMALVTAFVFRAVPRLASGFGREPRRAADAGLLALAALLPLARYEGAFVVLVVAVGLAWRRRVWDAVALGICAAAPLAAYGVVSVAHGWYPVPNSVLVKAAPSGAFEALGAVPRNLARARALAAVLVVGLALLAYDMVRLRRGWRRGRVLLAVFVAVSLLHLQLAAVGWFYRYEAYLILLGVLSIARWLYAPAHTAAARPGRDGRTAFPPADSPARVWAARLAVALLALAVASRTMHAWQQSPVASQNIYQQQIQMGRFLAASYPGRRVAANDIGAINYLADLRCTDLMGLASMPIARLRLTERRRHAEDVDRVVRDEGARIAVAYESWFRNGYITDDGRIPPRWGEPVGRWVIPDNVAAGGDTVSFFAFSPGDRDSLRARLRAFSRRLPAAVAVELR